MANNAVGTLAGAHYPLDESTLEYAKELVVAIESSDAEKAVECVSMLASLHESALFQELGKLTREFHEALNSFYYDERINKLTQADIPDAKHRLSYVIQKTDEAAHRTLSAVEDSIPICERLGQRSLHFLEAWGRFRKKEMKPEEFRELSRELADYFRASGGDSEQIKNNLTAVLMAQDFQDLTGQIIKRVIKLVSEVEHSLVNLVKLGGGLGMPNDPRVAAKGPDGETLAGPVVPGLDTERVVNQEEVDQLLSSLGF